MAICNQSSQFCNTSCRSATYVRSFVRLFVCHKPQFQPTSTAVRIMNTAKYEDFRNAHSCDSTGLGIFEKLPVAKLVRNSRKKYRDKSLIYVTRVQINSAGSVTVRCVVTCCSSIPKSSKVLLLPELVSMLRDAHIACLV
jgi:hypothetical protein